LPFPGAKKHWLMFFWRIMEKEELQKELDRLKSIPTLMPFGKFAGQPLADLPADYLRWALDNMTLSPGLAKGMLRALVRKPVGKLPEEPIEPGCMPFGKHKGEKISDLTYYYCRWLLDNCEKLSPGLQAELEERCR
jgi:uncharacterized protein (DUF3820 family)